MTSQKKDFKVTITAWEKIPHATGVLVKDAKSVRNKIHSLAVSILKGYHDDHKRGPQAAKMLTDVMNASPYHANAFSKWMTTILKHQAKGKESVAVKLPFDWNEETECFSVHKDKKLMGKEFITFRDNPFWTVSPPSKPKPFDFNAELMALIARAGKRIENPKDDDTIDTAQVRAVKSLVVDTEDS